MRTNPFGSSGSAIREVSLAARTTPNMNPVPTVRVQTLTIADLGMIPWTVDTWRCTCAGGAWLAAEVAAVDVNDGVNPIRTFAGIAVGGETDAQMAALVYADYVLQAVALNYVMTYTPGNAFIDLAANNGAPVYGVPLVVPAAVATDSSVGSTFTANNSIVGAAGSLADFADSVNFVAYNAVQYRGVLNDFATAIALELFGGGHMLTSTAVGAVITMTGLAATVAGNFTIADAGSDPMVTLTFANVALWSNGDPAYAGSAVPLIPAGAGVVSLAGATTGGTVEVSCSATGSATIEMWTKDATTGLWFKDVVFGATAFGPGNSVKAFVLNGESAYAFLSAVTGAVNVVIRSTN